MLNLAVLTCMVAVGYSTICLPADFDSFQTCMNNTAPHPGPADFAACFTTNGCSVPSTPAEGSSDESEGGSHEQGNEGKHGKGRGAWNGKGGGAENHQFSMFGPDVNATLAKQCAYASMKDASNDIKTCVQAKQTGFDFPTTTEGGMGNGKGKGRGKGFHGGIDKSQCAAASEVGKCIRGLVNQSAICGAMETCKAQATCNATETQEAVCYCAKSTIEANGQRYANDFFTCLGTANDNNPKTFKMMKRMAIGKFCERHDEMPMCNGEPTKEKGGMSGLKRKFGQIMWHKSTSAS